MKVGHCSSHKISSNFSFPLSIFKLCQKIKLLVSIADHFQAFDLYRFDLLPLGSTPWSLILPTLIKASCSVHPSNQTGFQLHSTAVKSGSATDPVVSNSILSMYSNHIMPQQARKVFDTMSLRDFISWNAMLNCYLKNELFNSAFAFYKLMLSSSVSPKPEVIAGLLPRCGERVGRAIHGLSLLDAGTDSSVFLQTSFVDFYFRCGDVETALKVFDDMGERNEVTWTAVVSGCVNGRRHETAALYFKEMQAHGCRPNAVTLAAFLPACREMRSLKFGKEIHGYAVRIGADQNVCVCSSLIHAYSHCGAPLPIVKAIFERSMKRNVILWSVVIDAAYRRGAYAEAVKLFNEMMKEGGEVNYVALLPIVSVCSSISALELGTCVHCYTVKKGLDSDVTLRNALIDMYSKCGDIAASNKEFEETRDKDLISWSTMIRSLGLHGFGKEALRLYRELRNTGIEVDEGAVLAALSACNHAGMVEQGKGIVKEAKERGEELTVEVYNCLIDLLGRAGEIEEAFDAMKEMESGGMEGTVKVYGSLVQACKACGRLDSAEVLARELVRMEPENAGNYVLLCMIFAESGDWERLGEVRSVMKQMGLSKSRGYSNVDWER